MKQTCYFNQEFHQYTGHLTKQPPRIKKATESTQPSLKITATYKYENCEYAGMS